MDAGEATKQISQMVEFIRQEAREKAEEIKVKTDQEFNIQKLELIENAKVQIRNETELHKKEKMTKMKIKRSALINKSRLARVKERNDAVVKVRDSARAKLQSVADNPMYGALLTALIVQGLLRLKEERVTVRVRKQDKDLAASVLAEAEKLYTSTFMRDVGIELHCSLELDTTEYLPAGSSDADAFSCSGGVLLLAQKGRILIDNTLDRRLDLAYEQLKPQLRAAMFTE